ncbi:radical SAM protein [Novosphingobium lindaniclasticum]
MQRRVEFVVKASKLCNLRCRYCYEFEHLASRERMAPEDLERMFRHIADWQESFAAPTAIDFVWHGGEPLLNGPDYFAATFDAQRAIFGSATSVHNTIQTNLTLLDDSRIELLRRFDRVGVSIDLFGALRTNLRGEDSTRRVLSNMDRLQAAGIDYGCITVLSARNAPHICKIVRFYHQLGVRSVRLLWLIDGAFENQHEEFDLGPAEVVTALQEAFEELRTLGSELLIEPLTGYMRQVVHHHTPGATPMIYDKADWESVFLVDTNGELYSYGNAYESEFAHGNVFRQPMDEILRSSGHARAIETAEARMNSVCTSCRFLGSCSGYPMAEEAALQERRGAPLGCNIDRPMLEYIERRLQEEHPAAPATPLQPPSLLPASIAPHHARPEQLRLQRDVRIRLDTESKLSPQARFALSAGTTDRTPAAGDGPCYIAEAIVPLLPFRPASARESELLLAEPGAAWQIGRDIAVIRVPECVVAPLSRVFADFGTSQSLANYRDHTAHPDWHTAYDLLSAHIAAHHSLDAGEPRVVRLGSAETGKTTVTKDAIRGREGEHYVGMHVDSWTGLPLAEREHAQNRICVNLGRSPRSFLFVNLSLARMHAVLHGTSLAGTAYYGSDLGHAFLRAFPNYPVVRLTIEPGEAYIAPTENLIHDATTLGMISPDLALHMIGFFAPQELAQQARREVVPAGAL